MIEVLSTGGDPHLGGDDWDGAITEWLVEKHLRPKGVDCRVGWARSSYLLEGDGTGRCRSGDLLLPSVLLPTILQMLLARRGVDW